MNRKWCLILLLGIQLLALSRLAVAGENRVSVNAAGSKSSPWQVRLITFSPTDGLFEWFGHTVLEIRHRGTGEALAFSFGGFYFRRQDLLKFMLGQFWFWSTVEDADSLLQRYRATGRHIVYQTLRLTEEQSRCLRLDLAMATRPENRTYRYNHFLDNCATRLRDVIDQSVDGQLKRQTDALGKLSFRDHIHRLTAHQAVLNFLLNFVLSDGVDRPISHWESMFLPDRLLAEIQKAVVADPMGGVSRPLVQNRSEELGEGASPFFSGVLVVPQAGVRETVVGLSAALVLALAAGWYLKGRRGRFLYPGLVAWYGTVFGLMGVALFFMSCIAEHQDVYWNENFFLASPLTFLLLPAGIAGLWKGGRRPLAVVSLLCGAVALVGLLLKLLPAFDQVNGQQLRVMLPVLLVMGITGLLDLRKLGRHQDGSGIDMSDSDSP